MIHIKSYPANNGDAFMIRCNCSKTAIMLDGGYAITFKDHILPDIYNLAAEKYELSLVVASHIDADHIGGLLELFKINGESSSPKIIPIREVFHNSLRSVAPLTGTKEVRSNDDKALIRELESLGLLNSCSVGKCAADISARQGGSLAKLLQKGNYLWNRGDGSQSISSEGLSEFHLIDGLSVEIIGPPLRRLEKLYKWWDTQIRKIGLTGGAYEEDLDPAFEVICSQEKGDDGDDVSAISHTRQHDQNLEDVYQPDTSVTNGSSLSLIVKIGATRLLMLADAWADDVEAALRTMTDGDKPLFFDVIKISHHGSNKNTSPSLLKLIDSPNYLISSNGDKHGHPDFEVLKAIVDRPAKWERKLHFNYETSASKLLRQYKSISGSPFIVLEGQRDWVTVE